MMLLQAAGSGAALGAPVKPQLAQRSSFGLHSPDGTHFGAETKDYNLREYLQQLKYILYLLFVLFYIFFY